MATKPSIFVDYAQNANYSIGPQAGQPTKVAIDAQDIDEGNIKGPVFFPDAQKFNYVQNAYGLWIRWIDEEVFSTEDNEFQSRLADKASPTNVDLLILESQVDGFAKRKVTVANLLGSLSWKDVLDADPVSGANTPIISQGQKIRGTTAASGGALPVIGGDGTTGPGGPGQIGGGDTATGSAAGDGVVSGGDATAGTGAGGDAISRPGTSFGGVAGKVLWELPNGDVIAMPSAKATVAGQVLTDAAADGNLSWAAGAGGDLAAVLADDNITDGSDIVLSSGDKVVGATGATGVDGKIAGGVGSSGAGGKGILESGTGSTVPGVVEIRTGAFALDVGMEFYLGSSKFVELAAITTPPTGGTGFGLYVIPDNADFTVGFKDRTTAGNGAFMTMLGQTASDGDGGNAQLFGGNAGGTNNEGGTVENKGGAGTGTAAGGDAINQGGVGGTSAGALAGRATMRAGAIGSATDGVGAPARVESSAGGSASGNDGDTILATAHGTGSGRRGAITKIQGGVEFERQRFAELTTSNNTPTTIITIPTTINNSTLKMRLSFEAINTTTLGVNSYDAIVTFKRDNSSVVTEKTFKVIAFHEDDVALDISANISSQNIEVQAKGHPTNSVKWRVSATWTEES